MKIVKRGKNPDEVVWLGQCPKCDSVIEAVKSELRVEYDQREHGDFGRARCPSCSYEMVFYPKDSK